MEHETFWSLLCSPAHIELELFLMLIFDVVIGAIFWPLVLRPRFQRWQKHHRGDDDQIAKLQRRVAELERLIKNANS